MKISLTDLDLFLDELRHRGPNVEPVVRVRHASEGSTLTTTYQLLATYARQYGERVATVELRYRLGAWDGFLPMLFGRTEQQIIEDVEKQERVWQTAEEMWTRKYDEARARIAAVAGEIGVAVAGGEVTEG